MRSTLHQRAFLLLLALVTIAFLWILIPFYGAVFWAVILGIIFRPVQVWLESHLKRRNLAAAISVVFCIVLAIIPMTLVLASLINQGAILVESIQSGDFTLPRNLSGVYDTLPDWAQNGLDGAGIADFDALRDRLASALRQASQFLATQALSVGQNTLRFIASLGIMLYVLFFMFRDGPHIGRNIRNSLPLSREYSDALLSKFAEVVRATVKGNVIIAVIQGVIGGIAFWALGIQGALIWGAMMVLASMIPAVGAALIWAPAAGYLMLSGEYLERLHPDRGRRRDHRPRRQRSSPAAGRGGNQASGLCYPRVDARGPVDFRHQRLCHRAADRRSVLRMLDAVSGRAGGAQL